MEDTLDKSPEESRSDTLGAMVEKYFRSAQTHRQHREYRWREAEDNYNCKFQKATASVTPGKAAPERNRLFIPLVRRQVNSVVSRLRTQFLDGDKISIKGSTEDRLSESDIARQAQELQISPEEMIKEFDKRAYALQTEIHEIVTKTGMISELKDWAFDQVLLGTGVLKSPVLRPTDFPTFADTQIPIAERLMPTAVRCSPWAIYPNPGATNRKNMDHVIHRAAKSDEEMLALIAEKPGYDAEAIRELVHAGGYGNEGHETAGSYERNERDNDREGEAEHRKHQVLEFWGRLPTKALAEHIDGIYLNEEGRYYEIDDEGMEGDEQDFISEFPESAGETMEGGHKILPDLLPVVVVACGGRVLYAAQNPFEGAIPFHFASYNRNPDSIWGDGVNDDQGGYQEAYNRSWQLLIHGKELASLSRTVVRPGAFEENTDFANPFGGQVLNLKGTNTEIEDSIKTLIQPDVSDGLVDLIRLIEHESDLTGLSPAGLGGGSSSRTATETDINDRNTSIPIMEATQSLAEALDTVLAMMGVWISEQSQDPEIRGMFTLKCTAYNHLANTVRGRQDVIAYMQTLAQMPELAERLDKGRLLERLNDLFNLKPGLTVGEEEFAQRQQQSQQAQSEAEAAAAQAEAEKQIALVTKAGEIKELQNIGSDARKSISKEREIILQKGRAVNPSPIQDISPMLDPAKAEAAAMAAQQESNEEMKVADIEANADQFQQSVEQSATPPGFGGNA